MKRTIRNSYYAYKLINSKDGKTFYVGKGYSTRMYAHKTEALKDRSEWSNPHKCHKILKLLKSGYTIKYDYVLCESEDEAIQLEEQWINDIGLDNLTNIVAVGVVANPAKKPVDVYDINGIMIGQYESASDATRKLSISDVGIVRRCLKDYDTLQTYKGMVFVYKDEKFNYTNNKTKTVIAETLDEKIVFDDTTKAANFLDRSKSCVRQSCKNNWKIKGYIMRYGDYK